MRAARDLVALLVLLAACLMPAWAEGEPKDALIGAIDEGKVYREVDGHKLTGREVADELVRKRWTEELAAFRDHILIRTEAERQKVEVADKEVADELTAMARNIAPQIGGDPAKLDIERMARLIGANLNFLRESTRDLLLAKRLLVKAGRLKDDANMAELKNKQLMQEYLEKLARQYGVIMDPAKTGGAALVIEGVGYSKERVRTWIVDRLGSISKSDLIGALNQITLVYLAERLLKAQREQGFKEAAARAVGKPDYASYEAAAMQGFLSGEDLARFQSILDEKNSQLAKDGVLSQDDRVFHYSYLAGVIKAEQGVPNGREVLKAQLQQQGWSEEQFLRERPFEIDAMFTSLARSGVSLDDIAAEFEKNKDKYQRKEVKIAHLFIRVRDPQGEPYRPHWQVPGNDKMNAYVAKVREEQFAKEKPRIEALVAAAQANFAKAAESASEDDNSKGKNPQTGVERGGGVGRIGPETMLPQNSIDPSLYEQAKKLKPGEVSGPVRSESGWHILKSMENQETLFEEAQQNVYVVLLQKKRRDLSEGLIRKAKIEDKF